MVQPIARRRLRPDTPVILPDGRMGKVLAVLPETPSRVESYQTRIYETATSAIPDVFEPGPPIEVPIPDVDVGMDAAARVRADDMMVNALKGETQAWRDTERTRAVAELLDPITTDHGITEAYRWVDALDAAEA